MDDDVKLNLEQAHIKWLARRALVAMLALFALAAFWVHDCNRVEKPCTDVTINPAYYQTVACPDPRQTLSYPLGWTWARCACPSK